MLSLPHLLFPSPFEWIPKSSSSCLVGELALTVYTGPVTGYLVSMRMTRLVAGGFLTMPMQLLDDVNSASG